MQATTDNFTLFADYQLLASGTLAHIALAVKKATEGGAYQQVLLFNDLTCRVLDIDTHGTEEEVLARYAPTPGSIANATAVAAGAVDASGDVTSGPLASSADSGATEPARGRGRPRLGVVAREVTLLPRHWEWLQSQSGGASVVLRRLVDEARRANEAKDQLRQTRDRTYHFMSAIAGNLPGFESATRALYAGDAAAFDACIQDWPPQVREHIQRLQGHGTDLR